MTDPAAAQRKSAAGAGIRSRSAPFLTRHRLKQAGILAAGFAALQLVFFGLLVIGQSVPDRQIVNHLASAIEDGTYGPSGAVDRMGGRSDAFTECVVVGTGLGSSGMNAFQRAVIMPRISNCSVGREQILQLAAGQDLPEDQVGEYYRYWAGYTVLTRPVLAVVGIEGLRIVAGALLVVSGAAAVVALARRTRPTVSIALFAPLLLGTNIMSTPSTSFSHALSISAISLGAYLTAKFAAKGILRLIAAVSLGASVFCYVDLLTTPAIPWAFSGSIVAVIMYARTQNLRKTGHAMVAALVIWPVAFGATWASRWLIAVLFLGPDKAIPEIAQVIGFRTAGTYRGVDPRLGAATTKNFYAWFENVPTATLVLTAAILAATTALVMAMILFGPARLAAAALMAVPAFLVPLWYEVLSNHSQIHTFFAYRGMPVALGVILAGCAAALLLPTHHRENRTN